MEGTGFRKRFQKMLPAALTVLVMTGMVFLSEKTGEKEILFPEIAALAFGYLLSPVRAWMVNRKRMIFLMSLCALLGLLLSRCLPFPYWVRIALAFFLSQVIFMYSGTTLAPLVSAVVLPVVLKTTSFIYPLAACMLTLTVILLRTLLEKLNLRPHEPYIPIPRPDQAAFIAALVRCALISVLSYVCVQHGVIYILAPPLLVFFTEASQKSGRIRKAPFTSVLFISMCALAGTSARVLLTLRAGCPLALAALLASILLLIIVYIFNLYLPPAGAACMLAMLVPEESLLVYPIQILIGGAVYMVVSLMIGSALQRAGRVARS